MKSQLREISNLLPLITAAFISTAIVFDWAYFFWVGPHFFRMMSLWDHLASFIDNMIPVGAILILYAFVSWMLFKSSGRFGLDAVTRQVGREPKRFRSLVRLLSGVVFFVTALFVTVFTLFVGVHPIFVGAAVMMFWCIVVLQSAEFLVRQLSLPSLLFVMLAPFGFILTVSMSMQLAKLSLENDTPTITKLVLKEEHPREVSILRSWERGILIRNLASQKSDNHISVEFVPWNRILGFENKLLPGTPKICGIWPTYEFREFRCETT